MDNVAWAVGSSVIDDVPFAGWVTMMLSYHYVASLE
jgi:hypothetical protein